MFPSYGTTLNVRKFRGELKTLTPTPRTTHWPQLRGLPYGLLRGPHYGVPLRTTLKIQPTSLFTGERDTTNLPAFLRDRQPRSCFFLHPVFLQLLQANIVPSTCRILYVGHWGPGTSTLVASGQKKMGWHWRKTGPGKQAKSKMAVPCERSVRSMIFQPLKNSSGERSLKNVMKFERTQIQFLVMFSVRLSSRLVWRPHILSGGVSTLIHASRHRNAGQTF